MCELRDSIENQERETRKSWIEFTGIPNVNNEGYMKIIEKIHLACGEEFSMQDIKEGFIKPEKNGRRSMLIKYNKAERKEKIQKAVRVKKLKSADLGDAQSGLSIFANDSLSFYSSKLFWQTRKARYERKWNSAWTFRGRIFIKMENEGNAINIKTEQDLTTLLE